MNVRMFVLIAALVGGCPAYATHNDPPPSNGPGPSTANSASNAHADADAHALSLSKSTSKSTSIAGGGDARSSSVAAGGAGIGIAEGGSAVAGDSTSSSTSSTGDSTSASNSGGNALTVNEARNKTVASTPAAVVGNTTAECRSFIGISGMGRDGGGGLGFPVTDQDCKLGILAETAFNRGNRALGAQLFCQSPTVKKTVGFDACLESFGESAPTVIVLPVAADTYSKAEINERITRAATAAAQK